MVDQKKITVVGAGYVGMSLSVLLAQKNNVLVHDIDEQKVRTINSKQSTVHDLTIDKFLSKNNLSLRATLNKEEAYKDADFIIIATPTDFDEHRHTFNTSSVEAVLKDALKINKDSLIVIKSTVPVGYTEHLRKKFSTDRIIFSPEFLREGNALMDNLYPNRIIVGNDCEKSKSFARLLLEGSKLTELEPMLISSTEAEAIKLFSNTFLAMRVAFFNEMDSFSIVYNLNIKNIIDGVCLDPRIGSGYNNPSFGYGGYCLPKDTKQLLANYEDIPQTLIQAIISSNKARKDFIADQIDAMNLQSIGFFRLVMKKDSDNFRTSAIFGILNRVKERGMDVFVYEPLIQNQELFNGFELIKDLDEFKALSDLIIANRMSNDLLDVESKVFTRDIFGEN